MNKEMERISGHTIVCGFGRMGGMLTQELTKAGKPFVVIDQDLDSVKEAETLRYLVIHGNATEEAVLERAGIQRARSLAAVLSDDAQNLFITITAHDMNPAMEILARGEFPATESKLLRCGASRVVSPATIGAIRMAHLITHPSAESLLQESDQQASLNEELAHIGLHLDELHLPADSSLVGSTLGEIEIKGHGGFLIVAIRRADNTVVMHPQPEEIFHIGDTLIVVGHQSDLPRLAERLATKKTGMTYRGTRIS